MFCFHKLVALSRTDTIFCPEQSFPDAIRHGVQHLPLFLSIVVDSCFEAAAASKLCFMVSKHRTVYICKSFDQNADVTLVSLLKLSSMCVHIQMSDTETGMRVDQVPSAFLESSQHTWNFILKERIATPETSLTFSGILTSHSAVLLTEYCGHDIL